MSQELYAGENRIASNGHSNQGSAASNRHAGDYGLLFYEELVRGATPRQPWPRRSVA